AFSSSRDDDWDVTHIGDLYVVDAEGGEPHRITNGGGAATFPSWSPDGSRFACLVEPGVLDFPRHVQIAVVEAAGGEPTILTAGLARSCAPYPPVREPIWHGDSIVFAVQDHGNDHLYAVSADGSG